MVVNLYPFETTIKKKSFESECIENIDIGGPSLIEVPPKNFNSVVVITSINQYEVNKRSKKRKQFYKSYFEKKIC